MQAKYGGVWWVSGWCLRVSGSVRMVSECVRQMSGVGRCHMQCQKHAETARLSENGTQKHQKTPKMPYFSRMPKDPSAIFFRQLFLNRTAQTIRTMYEPPMICFFWPGLRSAPLWCFLYWILIKPIRSWQMSWDNGAPSLKDSARTEQGTHEVPIDVRAHNYV